MCQMKCGRKGGASLIQARGLAAAHQPSAQSRGIQREKKFMRTFSHTACAMIIAAVAWFDSFPAFADDQALRVKEIGSGSGKKVGVKLQGQIWLA